MDTKGFYIGRTVDPATGDTTDQPLLYDPADLTTHAVVVGMTGSGKTGLCIDLLEEAALDGIPALMIDPKGDITNALLHFPDLAPGDFQPWVNPDQARRQGQSVEEAAAEAAAVWRQGLAEWGIAPDRLLALKNAVQFAVYTPGSDSGIPVSILASLKAPTIPWEGNREILREKISGTVTALLGLVGLQGVDPVRSREHILLANIFEQAWSQGRDLDLGELILQAQNPPFSRLGVFDVNTFFPERERFELAMLLNNILAAPAFQVWIEGQPLDIHALLHAPDGRPRHSVFYIAHLSEAERMFFVTLLFTAIETWMRAQSGTSTLRALVYFDEILGYLPPVMAPPSKQPMLRMLKQARAFGVGLVLATQNPVDLDYKALSNAGSWFIGKLQTDQDKQRLLDGLEGASPGLDRRACDQLISQLGKRVFLLHNVHARQLQVFQTRWAMNFLAGPLSRLQVPALNRLAEAQPPEAGAPLPGPAPTAAQAGAGEAQPTQEAGLPPAQPVAQEVAAGPAAAPPRAAPPAAQPAYPAASTTRPAIPAGVAEYFLPNNLAFTQAFAAVGRPYDEEARSLGLIYRPALLAQASVRFFQRKYNLDYELKRAALAAQPDRRGAMRWEEVQSPPVDPHALDPGPHPQARYAVLEAPLSEAKTLTLLQKDFLDWAYRASTISVRANEALKVYVGPQVSQAEFRRLCAESARQGRDEELRKIAATFDRKIEAIQLRLAREQREYSADETELSQRKMEEYGTHAENVLSLFTGRRGSRRLTTSLTKRRLTEQAKAEVEESRQAIETFKKEIASLEQEKAQALEEAGARWSELANQVSEIPVAAARKDVLLDLFGVAWQPYHLAEIGGQIVELPGYRAG